MPPRERQRCRKSVNPAEAEFAASIRTPSPASSFESHARRRREEIRQGKRPSSSAAQAPPTSPQGDVEDLRAQLAAATRENAHLRASNTRLWRERQWWSRRVGESMDQISATAELVRADLEFHTSDEESWDDSGDYTPLTPPPEPQQGGPSEPVDTPAPPATADIVPPATATPAGVYTTDDAWMSPMLAALDATLDTLFHTTAGSPIIPAEGGARDADGGDGDDEHEDSEVEEEDPSEHVDDEDDPIIRTTPLEPRTIEPASSPSMEVWSPGDFVVEVIDISSDESW